MNDERFEFLTGRLLEEELSEEESNELAAALRADAGRRRELRQHLVLWELWAQQHAPERSADAFLAAWHTRLRAERRSDDFVDRLRERLSRRSGVASLISSWIERWRAATGRIRIVWATAGAAVVVAVACLWLTLPQHARATTTIQGEAVCTACTLHETHEHLPAIRVPAGDNPQIYYVTSDRHAIVRLGDYCAAPVPLIATGRTERKHGRLELSISAVEPDRSVPAAVSSERRLFPF